MAVEVSDTALKAMFLGHTYYFCCGGCRERFLATPDRFVAAV
jgi:YHS domain-containing protein